MTANIVIIQIRFIGKGITSTVVISPQILGLTIPSFYFCGSDGNETASSVRSPEPEIGMAGPKYFDGR